MQQIINIVKRIVTGVLFTSALAVSCFAQTLPDVENSFKTYSENNLQEKLFVHTDRTSYLTGEILWFKIYAVDGTYNKPLNLSKVAYVDILDSKQTPVLQAKISLSQGSGSGSIYIPVTLSNGNYRLRAYTNWMKNFSPEYYFGKVITIVNPQISPDAGAKQNKGGYDIQFFPEGGNLVSGIQSKVGFKAVGADGKGIDFKGAIIDQKNDTVVKFSPSKFGMGHFLFTPAKGSFYKAVIRTWNDKPVLKDLPAVADQGYVMQLTDDNSGKLDVSVSSNSSPNDNVFIFVQTRQIVKIVKTAALNNGVTHFQVDKNLLDDGVSHITIFNSARQPVCERLYFKYPGPKLVIDAAPDQQQYATRKRVGVSVQTKDPSGKLLDADLSMSVYRLDTFQQADPEDILNYLWLSSDLQGDIESPGYYFSNNSAEVDEATDNLMLTQGWRRFQWSSVLANNQPAFNFLPETYGHIVAGKLVNATTNAPVKGIVAYLGAPGKRVQLFASRSDSLGQLIFNTRNLNSDEIVVQTNTEIDSIYRIDILKPFSEQYAKTTLPAFRIMPDMQPAIESRNLSMQVQNVYDGDKIKQLYEPADSSAFFGKPDHSYLLDDYTRFTTMEEVLREYIREVNVVRSKKRFHIKVIGENGFLDGDPLVLVDGIPLFNIDKVLALDPLVIKRLDAVPHRYFYGPSEYEGILSLTSYKGNIGGIDIDPHAIVVDYEGLQLQRKFYAPVYDTDSQVKSRLPDFRNLLYWSPSVNANSRNGVSFYTSDQEGKYIGVVQGITSNGEAASHVFTFEVRK